MWAVWHCYRALVPLGTHYTHSLPGLASVQHSPTAGWSLPCADIAPQAALLWTMEYGLWTMKGNEKAVKLLTASMMATIEVMAVAIVVL